MHDVLIKALNTRQSDYTKALDTALRILDDLEDLDDARETRVEVRRLREAIELVGCLRRLVPAATVEQIHRAFGAPGDFGYETPIGDALARVYGVVTVAPEPEKAIGA